jgi:hypothetical protein
VDKVAVKTFTREFFNINNILQYLSQYSIEYCNILQYDFSGDIHLYQNLCFGEAENFLISYTLLYNYHVYYIKIKEGKE